MIEEIINEEGLVKHKSSFYPFGEIDEVISMLQEAKKKRPNAKRICIEEEWTGYEHVEYNLCVFCEPTAEEIKTNNEIKATIKYRQDCQRKAMKAEQKKQNKIKELERQLRGLR